MRKENFIFRGAILLLLISVPIVNAQFQVQAEFRPRFELRDGYKSPLTTDQDPAFVTSQRSRINMSYLNDGVEIYLSLQDVRVWGDELPKVDNAVVNVFQAYAGYSFNEWLSIRLGRQELAYDNKRLLGPSNFTNVGASHNVAILRYKLKGFKTHLAAAYNNNSDKLFESNYPLDYYKYLTFLWIHQTWDQGLSLSLMNIADGRQMEDSDNKIYNRLTSGIYGKWDPENSLFGFDAAFYYQYGQSGEGLDLNAYYFSFSPFINIGSKVKFLLGIEYLSGDDEINADGEDNAFDKLYGDGHAPFGYMDYFTALPAHTKHGGLMDTYLRLAYDTGEKTSAELSLHNFALTGSIADTLTEPGVSQTADKHLGIEIDFMLKYKLAKAVEFSVGYSTMLADNSMEIVKGGDAEKYQQWFWLMLTFKPTLFKHEF